MSATFYIAVMLPVIGYVCSKCLRKTKHNRIKIEGRTVYQCRKCGNIFRANKYEKT